MTSEPMVKRLKRAKTNVSPRCPRATRPFLLILAVAGLFEGKSARLVTSRVEPSQ